LNQIAKEVQLNWNPEPSKDNEIEVNQNCN